MTEPACVICAGPHRAAAVHSEEDLRAWAAAPNLKIWGANWARAKREGRPLPRLGKPDQNGVRWVEDEWER
jgi:hypothetical protein